jgi:hypothetical protein
MKKALLTLTLVVAALTLAMAQPRSIGVRLGNAQEVSYQHGFGMDHMLEIDAGVENIWGKYSSATATVTFDWILNFGGNFSIFLGPGAGLTYGFGSFWKDEPYWVNDDAFGTNEKKRIGILLGAQFGFEYSFDFPLILSLDIRPMYNFLAPIRVNDPDYLVSRLVNVGIGIRYRFD